MFASRESLQRKKNTFSSMSSEPEAEPISGDKKCRKTKKLGFFYCDSLAIRPQGGNHN